MGDIIVYFEKDTFFGVPNGNGRYSMNFDSERDSRSRIVGQKIDSVDELVRKLVLSKINSMGRISTNYVTKTTRKLIEATIAPYEVDEYIKTRSYSSKEEFYKTIATNILMETLENGRKKV